MSFRYPVTVYRSQPGQYVDGVYVPGGEIEDTIMATVQAAAENAYARTEATIGGRTISALYNLYSDTQLAAAGFDGQTLSGGDELAYRGKRYLIIASMPWQSNVINHFHMLAAEFPE